ncbi:putative Nitroreductase family [Monocercomonoides exilis]|uniref:putative Nitroreductase family n=1 Tax=Monocercomonoides exilis TaxID=2049356 RepID=UPI00355A9916|nr:putative Nitroreductase family [Monocercomonoides exilis]|eukprot:MONOS_2119.1-p1 / transcript=MONOS_2119.1 / gene=MONOS_2119 / organism=Monocercomonoides_exilis_PA203 / gene_product=unspecified product / transcript_product=unspecified product / location=Mono_scaffold00041:144957-145427(+) / protein_length=156 / sequence_SO=supercontig / SO=protein_coding / is_pseudo=false
MLDLAHAAPSGMNLQPWYFYVLNNLEKNRAIAMEVCERAKEQLAAKAKDAHDRGCSNFLFYDAPTVIYCCVPKGTGFTNEFDLGLAVENMMLFAQQNGFCTLPVGLAKKFGEDIIRKEIGIADEHDFFIALCVGYRASDSGDAPKPRKEEYAKWIE